MPSTCQADAPEAPKPIAVASCLRALPNSAPRSSDLSRLYSGPRVMNPVAPRRTILAPLSKVAAMVPMATAVRDPSTAGAVSRLTSSRPSSSDSSLMVPIASAVAVASTTPPMQSPSLRLCRIATPSPAHQSGHTH